MPHRRLRGWRDDLVAKGVELAAERLDLLVAEVPGRLRAQRSPDGGDLTAAGGLMNEGTVSRSDGALPWQS